MPVTDLADYLGMPQQAPANPVFNQTRRSTSIASLDQRADDIYKGGAAMDQLARLQRQAPVLQAQQAQLAYDEVAQQANDLRMKQEIEAQVERAANELAGGNLNPESDDFATKYRDLATRNPLAMSDPRFRQVAGLYEGQNQSYRQTRAAQVEAERAFATKEAEGLRTAIGDYLESGGAAEKAQGIKSIEEAKYLKGQLPKPGRSGAGGISADERRLKNILDARDNQLKRYEKKVEEGELEPTDAKYLAAVDAWEKANEAYVGMNQSGVSPVATAQSEQQQVNPSAAAARSALTAMASAATPFAPAAFPSAALANALPQVPSSVVKAPLDTVKTYESIPQKTEDDFVEFAGKEDVTPSFRQNVIKDLREFIAKPVPQAAKGGSLEEVESREVRLADTLKQAEEAAAVADENNLYREAWDKSKAKIDEALSTMAEASGYTPEQIATSIRSGGVGGVRFKIDGKRLTPKEWLESLVGGKFYDPATPFKQWANTTTGGQMAGKLAAEPWANVFESYMKEKTKPVASPVPQVNVAPTEWRPGQAVAAPGGGTITRTK